MKLDNKTNYQSSTGVRVLIGMALCIYATENVLMIGQQSA